MAATNLDAVRARLLIKAERARRRAGEKAPDDWQPWLAALFPQHVKAGFGDRHYEFWDWVWRVEEGARPRPLVAIWPRGGGKSTSCELAVAALGLRGKRRYVLYVRRNQDQADKSVANIAALLESDAIERYYPAHAERDVGKYGHSKGWRRNRLRTRGGLTVDAIGLDVAARGVKVEEQRPDLIVFDDIDEKHDTPQKTQRIIETITTSLLPAGSRDVAVLAVQNLIVANGVFGRLADGRADFLADRLVLGPYPAIEGLKTEPYFDEELGRTIPRIIAGRPTWQGQPLEACQDFIKSYGLSAFLQEAQHQVHEREGALWAKDLIARVDRVPLLKRVVVGVDPSGGGDEIGIVVVGQGYDGRFYVLADLTVPGKAGPHAWGEAAIDGYDEWEADVILGESNFGGNMVEAVVRAAAGKRHIPVKLVHASRGKALRAAPVASLYEQGLVSHVGTFPELEAEMTGWVPGDPSSPNRLDALVWCLTELGLQEREKPRRRTSRVSRSYPTVR